MGIFYNKQNAVVCLSLCLSAISASSAFMFGTASINCQKHILLSRSSTSSNNDPIGSYLGNLNNSQASAQEANNKSPQNNDINENNKDNGTDVDEDGGTLKASRFSKFAPDANTLDANEFRAQLKENMKADLERRRAEDPNRGNQITRNYLEGL